MLASPDTPFSCHPLNTTGGGVRGLAWNPTIANTFCVTFTDGAVAMYTLKVESGNMNGTDCITLPPAVGVVAVSWSPKGKQMVALMADGSLTQYKPDLKAAKTWAGPVSPDGLEPVSVTWLSTYEFLVGYRY